MLEPRGAASVSVVKGRIEDASAHVHLCRGYVTFGYYLLSVTFEYSIHMHITSSVSSNHVFGFIFLLRNALRNLPFCMHTGFLFFFPEHNYIHITCLVIKHTAVQAQILPEVAELRSKCINKLLKHKPLFHSWHRSHRIQMHTNKRKQKPEHRKAHQKGKTGCRTTAKTGRKSSH